MQTDRKGSFIGALAKFTVPLFWVVSMLLWEYLTHRVIYRAFTMKYVYAVCLDISIGLLLSCITQVLPEKARGWFCCAVSFLLTFVFGSQMVYGEIFDAPYTATQIGQGAQAVQLFFKETVGTIVQIWYLLLIALLPTIIAGILTRKKLLTGSKKGLLVQLPLCAAALVLFTVLLFRGGTGFFSDYYFFASPKSTTAQTAERYGILPTFLLEAVRPEQKNTEFTVVQQPIAVLPTEPEEETPEATEPEEEEVILYHAFDLDFEAMNEATENETIRQINQFVSQTPSTPHNEFTGKFSDYNLILMCCESFSPAAIDPEVTPTLYRLKQESIQFNNYYNSYPNITIDGEYALTQGLFPDHSKIYSMEFSDKNLLPFTLGNEFMKQKGIQSYGFHGNFGAMYDRENAHPNMGYQMAFAHNGMSLKVISPASDLEVFEKTVDTFLHEDQFHAYYMTYSGHYQYDPGSNMMANQNWNLVTSLPKLDIPQRAYLACHIELDRAMEYLLNRLEEEGIADKTVIVMASDHYPYGLTEEQYSGLLGTPIDDFSKFKSDLIMWVGGMEEPITTDAYCCNVDILPTLLNLWGFDYDSRMLSGTDIFSDGPHVAIFKNRSFLTDIAWFNTNTSEVIPQIDEELIPENYVENMCMYVDQKYTIAEDILNTDYYRFVMNYMEGNEEE